MSDMATQDIHESPDVRMQKRRARRWKRRARIVGPFLGVPALLATLVFSVDLIEYEPQPAKPRLSDRPIPTEVLERKKARAIPLRSSFSSTASVVAPSPLTEARIPEFGEQDTDLDLRIGSNDRASDTRSGDATRSARLRIPTPPGTLRGSQ